MKKTSDSLMPQFSGVATASALIRPRRLLPKNAEPGVPVVAIAAVKDPAEKVAGLSGNPKYAATDELMVPVTFPNTASRAPATWTILTLVKSSLISTFVDGVQGVMMPAIQPVTLSVPGVPEPQLQVVEVPLKPPLVKLSDPSITGSETPLLAGVESPSTLRTGISLPMRELVPPAQV
jgi:hypothetical protein